MHRLLRFLTSLLILLGSVFLPPARVAPIFPETKVRTQTAYDEGVFSMERYDIVVSPLGDDSNPGTLEAPLKTPQAAKEKAKKLKNADCGHVTVWFRAGTYRLAKTLAFTSEDLSDVTYRSYPGESVAFSGAKEISGWQSTTVNGVRAFVTDYAVNSDADYFNSLYSGDVRLPRPVYPKTGEFAVADARDDDALNPGNDIFAIHTAFYADTKDILNFKNLQDVDTRILHFWNDELLPLSSVSTETGRIELQKPASMSVRDGDRYFFENVFEALSEPGEWYLDRADGKLYYVPKSGETPENTVLEAGMLELLVTLDGCSGIDFQGIEFCMSGWDIHSGVHFVSISEDTIPAYIKYLPNMPQACYDSPCALTLTKCEDVNFTDCEFRLLGFSGLQFGRGCRNCTVKASEFDNIGGNAVYIKGTNDKDSPLCTSQITVTDCHIKTYGRVFNNAIGVLLIDAFDCEISQNEIHDGFYTAISSGWVWGYGENITNNIQIKNNLIYDIGQGWLSDMGGIYTLGIQPDSVISGNVIHDVGCYSGGSGYGGWGVYLDEGSSEILVENNLAYSCSSQGFHQHYGKDNMVRNNIFALNGDGQLRVSRKEEHNSINLSNNILVGNDELMYYEPVAGQFTDNSNVYWDYSRGADVLSGVGTDIKNGDSRLELKKMGYYNNALFADPLFKDAANGDFTLADNSPALAAGFTPWDYSAAGTLTKF